ncbi:MAG: prepilin-type N-terminal cleavage/methylation domain-containing protein [bacterium]|nr:prepilin-type N-terminal cleavage/methylation domain-containing protein [bacterium]
MKKEKGLTLVEMIFAAAIIALIVVGLNVFFINTLRTWWQSKNILEVTREATHAQDRLIEDLKTVRRTTIDNLLANPGFVTPERDGMVFPDVPPDPWTMWEGIAYPVPPNWHNENHNMHNPPLPQTNFFHFGPNAESPPDIRDILSVHDPQCIGITNLNQNRYEWRSETISGLNAKAVIFGCFADIRFFTQEVNFAIGRDNDGDGVPYENDLDDQNLVRDHHLCLIANINDRTPNNDTLDGNLFPVFWTVEQDTGFDGGNVFSSPGYQWTGGVILRGTTRDVDGRIFDDEINSIQLIARVSGLGDAVPDYPAIVHFDNFYVGELDRERLTITAQDGDDDNRELGEGSFTFAEFDPRDNPGRYVLNREWRGIRSERFVKRIDRNRVNPEDLRPRPRFIQTERGVEVYIPFNKGMGNQPQAPLEFQTVIYPRVR